MTLYKLENLNKAQKLKPLFCTITSEIMLNPIKEHVDYNQEND